MKNNKTKILFITLLSLLNTANPLLAEKAKAPHEIAGIALGSDVNDYPDIVQNNFLQEVVVTDWHGFRKGTISYGTCKNIDQILKMDMKYDETSEEFHKQLLGKFRAQFGEPDAWQGDSFGVMRIWKWQFIDDNNNPVSLVLQYNGKNSNETIGNMVRLSYPEKIAEERLCFNEICRSTNDKADEKRREEKKKSGWSYFVPR